MKEEPTGEGGGSDKKEEGLTQLLGSTSLPSSAEYGVVEYCIEHLQSV